MAKLTEENAIETYRLALRTNGRLLLDDVSIKIPKGQITGILGPNGAGKTTLLKALSGFARATSGQIAIFGQALSSLSVGQRAKRLAHLPQNLETHFHFEALDIVMMGRYAHSKGASHERDGEELARKALERCNISHLAHRSFANLSGGEKKLVLLARCLCQDSPIFLLDEVTSSLDIRRKMEVFELLRDEVESNGRTVVVVIHDINLASLYLDRLIFLKRGKVIGQGDVMEILDDSYLTRVFGTRTVVIPHPECNRPAVLFSPPGRSSGDRHPKGGNNHV